MAATYYMSVNDMNTVAADVAHVGTSSTAGDVIEIRMGNGTYLPTHREVLNSLEIFMRFLIQAGLDGAGANLPPNRG